MFASTLAPASTNFTKLTRAFARLTVNLPTTTSGHFAVNFPHHKTLQVSMQLACI